MHVSYGWRRVATTLLFLAMGALLALASVLVDAHRLPLDALQQALVAAQAVVELGPGSGWLCVSTTSFSYDPRHEAPPAHFLAERPEAAVAAIAEPGTVVEQVEVLHQGIEARVWTVRRLADGGEQRHRFTLGASRLARVSMDLLPDRDIIMCNKALAGWQVVAQERVP